MRRSTFLALAALIVAFGLGYASTRSGGDGDGATGTPAVPDDARGARVQRVVDGDTIVLAGVGRVRLIGVDTPEVFGGEECFGARASRFTRERLGGAEVRYAVGREQRDRYGRLLAYVWLEDGSSFNAALLAGGYARTLTIAPNDRYAASFAAAADKARRADAGLWGAC